MKMNFRIMKWRTWHDNPHQVILERVVIMHWITVAILAPRRRPLNKQTASNMISFCVLLSTFASRTSQFSWYPDVLFDSWDIWKQTDSRDLGTGPAYQNQTHMSASILNICKLKKILWSKNVDHVKETTHCFLFLLEIVLQRHSFKCSK